MISIGFRASAKDVIYAIVSEEKSCIYRLNAVEKIKIPVSLTFPEQLNFLRKTVKDIIREFEIPRAGIRTVESIAQNKSVERISFEAIIQEVLSCSTVKRYVAGDISVIFSKLGIEKADFKTLVESKKANYKNLSLSEFKSEEKEAIFVAIASLKI